MLNVKIYKTRTRIKLHMYECFHAKWDKFDLKGHA